MTLTREEGLSPTTWSFRTSSLVTAERDGYGALGNILTEHRMSNPLPRTTSRPLQFRNGCAIGISNRWQQGQYCSILTEAGIVGCGIYDVHTAGEFGQAVAIARGTPAQPLVEPEDLFEAKIVDATPQARALGITIGMTGREAVELLLAARRIGEPAGVSPRTSDPTDSD